MILFFARGKKFRYTFDKSAAMKGFDAMPTIAVYADQKEDTWEAHLTHQLKINEERTQAHQTFHNEPLTIDEYFFTEDSAPFHTNQAVKQQLASNGRSCLPLVYVDDQLFCQGRLPTIREWEQLTKSGITVQFDA
ncbi:MULTISPECIES: arsenic metallochaperone ArsD family protein [Enterococcus]|uniref:arsenic metallochaperone ArsD family protein n=1 Tax=Enterococcus TaxID=1350 RepID=UPI00054DCB91|nr:arsenic metallochaperone ArsD family protein [Enterococcus casseliflavus]RXA72691.1 arsenic metallochaperone ArsD family protein [Enterococcus casseliflavus]